MSTHCGICFGQGHIESSCDSKPRKREDDSNPMHQIGYGRGDDASPVQHKPRVTQAYSFVNTGERRVDPTVPMHAVEILTVKDIVHRLVERNLQAWKALPEKIRDAMMEHPQNFQLIGNKNPKGEDFDYNIVYSGTVWRYHPTALVWVIADIIQ